MPAGPAAGSGNGCCVVLTRSDDPAYREKFVLTLGTVLKIGRSPTCQVSLTTVPGVSVFHAEIRLAPPEPPAPENTAPVSPLRVRDLSTNGTGLQIDGGKKEWLTKGSDTPLPDGGTLVVPMNTKKRLGENKPDTSRIWITVTIDKGNTGDDEETPCVPSSLPHNGAKGDRESHRRSLQSPVDGQHTGLPFLAAATADAEAERSLEPVLLPPLPKNEVLELLPPVPRSRSEPAPRSEMEAGDPPNGQLIHGQQEAPKGKKRKKKAKAQADERAVAASSDPRIFQAGAADPVVPAPADPLGFQAMLGEQASAPRKKKRKVAVSAELLAVLRRAKQVGDSPDNAAAVAKVRSPSKGSSGSRSGGPKRRKNRSGSCSRTRSRSSSGGGSKSSGSGSSSSSRGRGRRRKRRRGRSRSRSGRRGRRRGGRRKGGRSRSRRRKRSRSRGRKDGPPSGTPMPWGPLPGPGGGQWPGWGQMGPQSAMGPPGAWGMWGGAQSMFPPPPAGAPPPVTLGSTAAAPTTGFEALKQQIYMMYQRFNPGKLSSLETILDKYKGIEHKLLQALYNKYLGGDGAANDNDKD